MWTVCCAAYERKIKREVPTHFPRYCLLRWAAASYKQEHLVWGYKGLSNMEHGCQALRSNPDIKNYRRDLFVLNVYLRQTDWLGRKRICTILELTTFSICELRRLYVLTHRHPIFFHKDILCWRALYLIFYNANWLNFSSFSLMISSILWKENFGS